MTTYGEAAQTIYHAMDDAWSETRWTLENEPFETDPTAEWARLTIRHFDSEQETLGRPGNRQFLRSGSVFVQVFVPSDRGTYRAHQLAQSARAIYEGRRIDGLRFYAGSTIELGLDGDFYQVNVEVPFDYNERK